MQEQKVDLMTKNLKNRAHSAFITLEAALILPLFFSVVYFFLFFFQAMALQESMHAYATQAARSFSSYGEAANELMACATKEEAEKKADDLLSSEDEEGLSTVFANADFQSFSGKVVDSLLIKEWLRTSAGSSSMVKQYVFGGYDGISFFGSSLLDEEGCITIVFRYELKLPVFPDLLPTLPVVQQVRMRSFNGYAVPSKLKKEAVQEETEQTVYITEHGSVYHTNQNCSYLRISVHAISSASIVTQRNKNGAKYYPCEKCFGQSGSLPKTVYVTDYGTCYHQNSDCTAIKRLIQSVSLSEVKGRTECKRCQAVHAKEVHAKGGESNE